MGCSGLGGIGELSTFGLALGIRTNDSVGLSWLAGNIDVTTIPTPITRIETIPTKASFRVELMGIGLINDSLTKICLK